MRTLSLVGLVVAMTLVIGCAGSVPETTCPASEPAAKDVSEKPTLDYTKTLHGVTAIDEAMEKVGAALVAQGFGVITDIDFQATLKKKLNVETRPYRILGACNPRLAHSAVKNNQLMGLLLPCKVVVYQNEEGAFIVSFARPTSIFTLMEDPELLSLAEEVDLLIRAAFDSL